MKMKKIIHIPLVLLSLGMLAACGNSGSTTSESQPQSTTTIPSVAVKFTVTFDTEGGSAIAPVQVEAGAKVARPAENPTPNDGNYGFEDWYDAKTGGNLFDFDQAINADTTVYARFGKKPEMLAAKPFRHFTVYERVTESDFIVKAQFKGSIDYEKVYNFTIDDFNGEYTFMPEDVSAGTKSFKVRYKSGGVEVTQNCVFTLDPLKVEFEALDNGVSAKAGSSVTGSVVIPEVAVINTKTKEVKEVKQETFSGNTGITSVHIGANVENINNGAFKNCTAINEINIDFDGLDLYIGISAFYGLTGLTTINFNGTKTEWTNYVGQHCDTTWKNGSTITTISCTDGTMAA